MRAKHSHRHIARKRQRAVQMIDSALPERFALNPARSLHAIARIKRERGGDILYPSDYAPQRSSVLDCLGGALRKEGDHRMSRIADHRGAPERKRSNWRSAVERPGPPLGRSPYKRPRFLRPSCERALKR